MNGTRAEEIARQTFVNTFERQRRLIPEAVVQHLVRTMMRDGPDWIIKVIFVPDETSEEPREVEIMVTICVHPDGVAELTEAPEIRW